METFCFAALLLKTFLIRWQRGWNAKGEAQHLLMKWNEKKNYEINIETGKITGLWTKLNLLLTFGHRGSGTSKNEHFFFECQL